MAEQRQTPAEIRRQIVAQRRGTPQRAAERQIAEQINKAQFGTIQQAEQTLANLPKGVKRRTSANLEQIKKAHQAKIEQTNKEIKRLQDKIQRAKGRIDYYEDREDETGRDYSRQIERREEDIEEYKGRIKGYQEGLNRLKGGQIIDTKAIQDYAKGLGDIAERQEEASNDRNRQARELGFSNYQDYKKALPILKKLEKGTASETDIKKLPNQIQQKVQFVETPGEVETPELQPVLAPSQPSQVGYYVDIETGQQYVREGVRGELQKLAKPVSLGKVDTRQIKIDEPSSLPELAVTQGTAIDKPITIDKTIQTQPYYETRQVDTVKGVPYTETVYVDPTVEGRQFERPITKEEREAMKEVVIPETGFMPAKKFKQKVETDLGIDISFDKPLSEELGISPTARTELLELAQEAKEEGSRTEFVAATALSGVAGVATSVAGTAEFLGSPIESGKQVAALGKEIFTDPEGKLIKELGTEAINIAYEDPAFAAGFLGAEIAQGRLGDKAFRTAKRSIKARQFVGELDDYLRTPDGKLVDVTDVAKTVQDAPEIRYGGELGIEDLDDVSKLTVGEKTKGAAIKKTIKAEDKALGTAREFFDGDEARVGTFEIDKTTGVAKEVFTFDDGVQRIVTYTPGEKPVVQLISKRGKTFFDKKIDVPESALKLDAPEKTIDIIDEQDLTKLEQTTTRTRTGSQVDEITEIIELDKGRQVFSPEDIDLTARRTTGKVEKITQEGFDPVSGEFRATQTIRGGADIIEATPRKAMAAVDEFDEATAVAKARKQIIEFGDDPYEIDVLVRKQKGTKQAAVSKEAPDISRVTTEIEDLSSTQFGFVDPESEAAKTLKQFTNKPGKKMTPFEVLEDIPEPKPRKFDIEFEAVPTKNGRAITTQEVPAYVGGQSTELGASSLPPLPELEDVVFVRPPKFSTGGPAPAVTEIPRLVREVPIRRGFAPRVKAGTTNQFEITQELSPTTRLEIDTDLSQELITQQRPRAETRFKLDTELISKQDLDVKQAQQLKQQQATKQVQVQQQQQRAAIGDEALKSVITEIELPKPPRPKIPILPKSRQKKKPTKRKKVDSTELSDSELYSPGFTARALGIKRRVKEEDFEKFAKDPLKAIGIRAIPIIERRQPQRPKKKAVKRTTKQPTKKKKSKKTTDGLPNILS